MSMRWSLPVLAISAGAPLALAPAASAQTATYLAVGDSLAYGFDTLTTTPRSLGDRGYVAPYADWLQSITGQRPRIVNLGVPAESTETFFTGGSLGYLFNSNYSSSIRPRRPHCSKPGSPANSTPGAPSRPSAYTSA